MTVLELPTPDPRALDDAARPFAEALRERYAIKHAIGRGGMGVVYLARDRRLDRLVAIKTLLPQLGSDAVLRERFVREARAAGGMSHANIVPIHEAGEIDGHVYFVMAYVDGHSVAALVGERGSLDARTVALLLRDVAAALAHAHGRGLIHRDVKAENILVDGASRRALVTDFGIARLAEAAPLTATGQVLGTVHYVSPEQVSGDRVDPRSDLYSLGVVGFLALTGRFPFVADLASAVLVAHVTKPAPLLASVVRGVPPRLAAVVDRCLAKDPAARFASAESMLGALDEVIADMDRTSMRSTGPRLSDVEAQAIWHRAAELQAYTGVQPRPATSPRPRPHVDAGTSGLGVEQIRGAAQEAGIDGRYVDHALAEHGITATGSAMRPSVSEREPPRRRWTVGRIVAGAPLEIRVERTVLGGVSPRRFDGLLNVVRDGTATLGEVTERGAGLRWETAWAGHRLEVSIVPRDGHTDVRLLQRIGAAALAQTAVAGVMLGGVAAPALGVLLDVLLRIPAPAWGIALDPDVTGAIAIGGGVATALLALPTARALVRRMHRVNEGRLRTLGDLLAARVEEASQVPGGGRGRDDAS